MSDQPASIEYKGYRIRVLNWNGRYKAWISKVGSRGGTEVSSGDWCNTHDAAIEAAKADVDAGRWH